MPTSPTAIDLLPTPPTISSADTFDARADAFLSALVPFGTQANAAATNVYANAVEAEAKATASANSATASDLSAMSSTANANAAATYAGAVAWISGTTYAIGDVRWSPGDNRIYRRRTTGGGTTDPSADPTNWGLVAGSGLQMNPVTGTSATLGANTHTVMKNAATWAATAPAAPAVGDALILQWDNARRTNTLNLGANSLMGPNGVARSGVITLNALGTLRLMWWGDYWRTF